METHVGNSDFAQHNHGILFIEGDELILLHRKNISLKKHVTIVVVDAWLLGASSLPHYVKTDEGISSEFPESCSFDAISLIHHVK